jgi:hypothetical protein
MRVTMTDGTDLSKLTTKQLLELKARVKVARSIVKYRSTVKEICDQPPEKSKDILCKMAKDVEEESIQGGWQKIVLNSIKNQME